MNPIYLDYNATTPIAPEVFDAMKPFLTEHFGNASSGHYYGQEPIMALYEARGHIAACLGAQPREILINSGGTEANNHAILGVTRLLRHRCDHVVISAIEHPAVENVCRWLESENWRVTRLPVDECGMVDPADLRCTISEKTALVSVMLANNEIGTIQPIRELAAIAREHGVHMHTDASQAIGKIAVKVDDLGVDLLTVAGHKLYAPKGVGALYVRHGVELAPLMHGGKQEGGRRAGTENIPYAVALGEACRLATEHLQDHAEHMRVMRDRLHKILLDANLDMRLNGHPELRLPNTLSVAFRGLLATDLLEAIEDDVACSAGSACHTGMVTASPVMQAMNVSDEWALGVLRLSTGRFTTEAEIDRAGEVVVKAVRSLRNG